MGRKLELSTPTRNMLEPIARAIVRCEAGYILGVDVLRALLQQNNQDAIIKYLGCLVQAFTQSQLTVRKAERELLYNYVQGRTIGIVTCNLTDAPAADDISERSFVQQAWFLMESGLLPATFDEVPANAEPYMMQANDM